MQTPSLNALFGKGWTYCPRCDSNSLIPRAGEWFCPWCGIRVAICNPPETMAWNEELSEEEVTREGDYLQKALQAEVAKQFQPAAWRVRACICAVRALAWLFNCKVGAVDDKQKSEEVTSEQGKRPKAGRWRQSV